MMVIMAIEWFGDDEAVVTVGDGDHQLRCFAYPFRGAGGDRFEAPLHTMEPTA